MRFLNHLGLLSATLLWLGILWAFAEDHATSLPLPNARTDPALGSEGTNKKIRSNVARLNRSSNRRHGVMRQSDGARSPAARPIS
jgi:hypothetical protein